LYFLIDILLRLPKVTSQWGEPLITAYDIGYGTENGIAEGKAQAPELECAEFAIVKRDGFLFDCADTCIEEGSRTCILGPGISTSCLMKILAKKLAPTEGTVHHSSGLTIGYCDYGEICEAISIVDQTTTALEFLVALYPKKAEKDLRGHLTGFGLSPTTQTVTPLACLSGGETFRFALAKTMLDNPPVLCLVNPTSHLDVESVQSLSYGLRQWNGTIIMICQDASFLRSLEGVKCVVVVPEEGKVRRIVDDDRGGMQGMDAYLRSLHNSKC
jgi:ATPase subunit of ABC transporter with duplicated ATPase domains